MGTIRDERLSKLEAIRAEGIYPYGGKFETSSSIKELTDAFAEGKACQVAGRIMAMRQHGKSIFCDLRDQSGKVQLYVKADAAGGKVFKLFEKLDIGDIIGVEGSLFKTRTGEATIKVEGTTLLSKSLLPLPEKWHGLKDVETRYRQRYLDLIVNQDVKKTFYIRTKIIQKIRELLGAKGFMEVETPMMHSIAGGAAGKPFQTHHNALDMDLYLRIAPEIYLKKLIVGGFEKIYEINRSFRNEGISPRHNPEFTMLEVYEAYSDCQGMMDLTEGLITEIAKGIFGTLKFEYQGKPIDLSKWEKVSFARLMDEQFGIKPDEKPEAWIKKLKKKNVKVEGKTLSRTQLINIVGDLIEPKAGNHPVFVVDMFTELCPLAKKKQDNPLISDRFELYMGGLEVANAYSELNDPIEQKKRFLQDKKETRKKEIDESFITALEHGMPPAGGLGIGIDRLVMILTNSASIRDVILFPQLKKEK